MDKLKNIISSNKGHDPAVDNTTDDLTSKNTVSGEGSHFGSGRTAGTDPLSSTNTTSATGGNLTGAGTHGLSEPHSSRVPGSFDDDAATTASVSSGIPGRGQAGNTLGSGVYDTDLNTNKPLPHEPTTGTGLTGSGLTGSGIGSDATTGSTGRSFPLGGNSTTGATTGSNTGSYAPGHVGTYPAGGTGVGNTGSGNTGLGSNTGSSGLGGNTGSSGLGGNPGQSGLGGNTGSSGLSSNTGSTGLGSNTTAGPHSSNVLNKADPRVDSDLDGRSGLGGNTTTGTSSGLTGNTSSTTGTGNSHLHRDAALGAGAGAGAGYGAESWEHKHGAHGHTYEGDPCGPETTAPGGPHFTSGPHSTDTANRLDPHVGSGISAPGSTTGTSSSTTTGPHSSNLLNKADPRVDSDRDGSRTVGNTGTTGTTNTSSGLGAGTGSGYGSSTTGTGSGLGSSTTGQHTGRDAALGAGAGAAGGGAYEAGRDQTTSSATGPAPTTAGPHKSDVLNKLDPRVDSDLSKQQSGTTGTGVASSNTGTTGSGLGSSTTGTGSGLDSSSTGHHTGRNAGLAGGAGAAGIGAYEAEKHHHNNTTGGLGASSTTGTSGLGSSSNPYSGSGIDPRVDGSRSVPTDSNATGTGHRDHHLGRDAALGAGAGGAAYEAEKHHHNKHDPTNTTSVGSSTTAGEPHHSHHQGHHDRQQHAEGHHHGRDAGLAGAGTAGAYEAERHHGHPTQSSTVPSTTGGITSSSRDPAGYGNQAGTDRHYGRDAGLVGAGGAGAYEAEKHLGSHDKAGERLAGTSQQPPTATGVSAQQPQHHHGRDAALGAGAVGAGGAAYEADKHHDAKKLEKEREKEIKHHNKEVAKEEKHDHDSGKKSGGILGIFHRDKGDKEVKREEREAEREAKHNHGATGLDPAGSHHKHGRGDEETAAGAGAVGLEQDFRNTNLDGPNPPAGGHPIAGSSDREYGSQAGVHDSAISSGSGVAGIGGGPTTHDAYGERDPNHINRLHKDPPAKILEQRGINDSRQL